VAIRFRKILRREADHQDKPDIAASDAREWFNRDRRTH
jgi:hypothetical protein